jgi:hypothetical protein
LYACAYIKELSWWGEKDGWSDDTNNELILDGLMVSLVECTCVELSGRKGQSSKQDKFQIDLSANNWRHHIDEPNLRLIINTSNTGTGRKLEEYVFKVKSREHLAAWAAEIIQSSTFLSGS